MSFADHYGEYTLEQDRELRKKELEEYMGRKEWIASNLQSAHDSETKVVLEELDNDNKLPSGSYIVTDENFEELLLKSVGQAADHAKHVSLEDVKHAEEAVINEMSEPNSFRGMLEEVFGSLDLDPVLRAQSPVIHEPPPIPNDNPHIADLVVQENKERGNKLKRLKFILINAKDLHGIDEFAVNRCVDRALKLLEEL